MKPHILGVVGGKREFVRQDSFGPVKVFKKYEKTTPNIVKYYTQRYANNWEPKDKKPPNRQSVKQKSVKKSLEVEEEVINKALSEKVKMFLIRLR